MLLRLLQSIRKRSTDNAKCYVRQTRSKSGRQGRPAFSTSRPVSRAAPERAALQGSCSGRHTARPS
eukprot:2787275-Pleurochrysis_carterae.AAC.1